MNFDPDSVLEELDAFGSSPGKELPQALEDYLVSVAKNGNTLIPWIKMKPVLKCKIKQVLGEFCKACPADSIPSLPNTDVFNFDNLKNSILEALDSFESAPFTIQRVCELITNPRKHYNRTDKYMRGLEKNLLVVSTILPKSSEEGSPEQTVKSQPAMVNGVSADSVNNVEHEYENCTSDEVPPVNGTVLENFATVFPSAPHITNPPSNIQVAIVSGADSYHSTQTMSTFTYCTDNSDEGFHDAPESTMTYETNTAAYCGPENEEKYIIIEELNSEEAENTAENSFQNSDTACFAEQEQCPVIVNSEDLISPSNGVDDSLECGHEPDRKRRKISVDSEVVENAVNLDIPHVDVVSDGHVEDAENSAQLSTNDLTNVPGSEIEDPVVVADSMCEVEEEAKEVVEN